MPYPRSSPCHTVFQNTHWRWPPCKVLQWLSVAFRVLFQRLRSATQPAPCPACLARSSPSATHHAVCNCLLRVSVLCHRRDLLLACPSSPFLTAIWPLQAVLDQPSQAAWASHSMFPDHLVLTATIALIPPFQTHSFIWLSIHQPISSARTGAPFYFLCASRPQHNAWHEISA